MPHLFQAADKASLQAQRSYIGGTRTRLLVLGAAAVIGICSWRVGSGRIDVLGILGVVAFVIATVADLSIWKSRPDKAWYDGRAVAESAKTLAWKFAVGALPFPVEMDLADARRALVLRLQSVREEFPGLELDPSTAPAISDWMLEQRGSGFDDRRESYLAARIGDQKLWYSTKAALSKKRSKQWRSVLVVFEITGAITSLIAALVEGTATLSPAFAALTVAIVAWIETKQYDFNARAYSAAISDLVNAEEKLKLAEDESSWAREVDDAEEAISREHVVWRATRSRI
jgi:SMODS and SLOG-associating 2TM effector domain 3/SMODS and SLOG-associating 2TM effector domain 1